MFDGLKYITGWDATYKDLKRIRWLRNQLAHVVGTLDSDFVNEADIMIVLNFYENMLNCNDPLSKLQKIKNNQRNNKAPNPRYEAQQDSHQHTQPQSQQEQQQQLLQTEKDSNFLSKLFKLIKKIFS